MFKYLAAICPLLVIVPYFGSEPLYPIIFSFIFALLGTIFSLISIKKETGILGKVTLFINALFLLIGILMLLFSVFWIISES
ncbi:hypothetical protein [Salinicoccus roseus]|uniref:hypothetical protein n=1 Tax=Salinicoccus roseus TaxID=45670 RepID=UPI000F4FA7EF|nr:hypothetical protein [Salinicoccus roseus]RPE54508.1 hypothetical protein EDC33_0763 [Salinicoccus roseus]GGA64985.1 hypothetical protein GCM10007176_06740 [Salinicoccus roseus]